MGTSRQETWLTVVLDGIAYLDELHERPRERFIHSVRKICQRRGRWTIKGSQCANAETLTGNADNMDLYLSQSYLLQISWAIGHTLRAKNYL